MDSTNRLVIFMLGLEHMYLGQLEESLKYFNQYVNRIKTLEGSFGLESFKIGYAFWVNGFKEEAESYFNMGFEYHNDMLESDRNRSNFTLYFDLAAIYAFLEDKEKAFENLRLFNQRQRMPFYMIKDIKNDPLFDSIREESEFQQIVRDMETKYQAEHERVRQWLEENDIL